MTYKEGLCKNCGSLIQVNPAQPEARCIFCWGKTDSQTAIDLLANPPQSFPNETISDAPPFDERMKYWRQDAGDNTPLNRAVNSKHNYENIARKEVKDDKLSAVSRLKMMKTDLLQVPKISLKNSIFLALGLVIIPLAILIIATVPKYLHAKADIAQMEKIIDHIVKPELLQVGRSNSDCVAIINNDIDNLRVVVAKEPDKSELQAMVKNLYTACEEIRKETPSEVNLQVISKEKSYAVQMNGPDNITVTELKGTR